MENHRVETFAKHWVVDWVRVVLSVDNAVYFLDFRKTSDLARHQEYADPYVRAVRYIFLSLKPKTDPERGVLVVTVIITRSVRVPNSAQIIFSSFMAILKSLRRDVSGRHVIPAISS